jgi:hypothetical protein
MGSLAGVAHGEVPYRGEEPAWWRSWSESHDAVELTEHGVGMVQRVIDVVATGTGEAS